MKTRFILVTLSLLMFCNQAIASLVSIQSQGTINIVSDELSPFFSPGQEISLSSVFNSSSPDGVASDSYFLSDQSGDFLFGAGTLSGHADVHRYTLQDGNVTNGLRDVWTIEAKLSHGSTLFFPTLGNYVLNHVTLDLFDDSGLATSSDDFLGALNDLSIFPQSLLGLFFVDSTDPTSGFYQVSASNPHLTVSTINEPALIQLLSMALFLVFRRSFNFRTVKNRC